MNQTTIKKNVTIKGIGLHSGKEVTLTLEPLGDDEGIVFYRSDLNVSWKANPSNVLNTKMATVLGKGNAYLSTTEHLLSAINSYGLDNIRISADNSELPILDGSAICFCRILDEAGIEILNKPKNFIKIKKEIKIQYNNKFVLLRPSDCPKFTYTIDFDHPLIGIQNEIYYHTKDNFLNNIASARTFGFVNDLENLKSKGLARGASLDNAIALDENNILNKEGLRFKNEFVKHKILDAIGDMSLLGVNLLADYEAFAGSHYLNFELTKNVLSNPDNFEIINEFEFLKALA